MQLNLGKIRGRLSLAPASNSRVRADGEEELLYSGGGRALEQVAHRGGGMSISGVTQNLPELHPMQPALPREVGLDVYYCDKRRGTG